MIAHTKASKDEKKRRRRYHENMDTDPKRTDHMIARLLHAIVIQHKTERARTGGIETRRILTYYNTEKKKS